MGRKPASGMEMTRDSQSRTLSTTVDPIPLAAIITVVSLAEIPSAVNRR